MSFGSDKFCVEELCLLLVFNSSCCLYASSLILCMYLLSKSTNSTQYAVRFRRFAGRVAYSKAKCLVLIMESRTVNAPSLIKIMFILLLKCCVA